MRSLLGEHAYRRGERFRVQRSIFGGRSRSHGARNRVSSKLHCGGNGWDFALAETMEIATISGSFEGIVSLISLFGTHLSSLNW